jgi:hypothetical protein
VDAAGLSEELDAQGREDIAVVGGSATGLHFLSGCPWAILPPGSLFHFLKIPKQKE